MFQVIKVAAIPRWRQEPGAVFQRGHDPLCLLVRPDRGRRDLYRGPDPQHLVGGYPSGAGSEGAGVRIFTTEAKENY